MFGYYWQRTMTWCGPACAQMVLYRLGLYVPPQGIVADLMGEKGTGTHNDSVCKGLRMLGVGTRIVQGGIKEWKPAIIRNGEVLIVAILSHRSRKPHWVIVDKYSTDLNMVHVCDPAWYPTWVNDKEFESSLLDPYVIGCHSI